MKNTRLKELRKALGLTQSDFAKKIGLTQTAVARLESGQTNLTEKQTVPICSVLGVNEEWLLFGSGEMFNNSAVLSLIQETANRLNEDNQKYALALLKEMLKTQEENS